MFLSRTTALLALSLTFPLDHFFFLLQTSADAPIDHQDDAMDRGSVRHSDTKKLSRHGHGAQSFFLLRPARPSFCKSSSRDTSRMPFHLRICRKAEPGRRSFHRRSLSYRAILCRFAIPFALPVAHPVPIPCLFQALSSSCVESRSRSRVATLLTRPWNRPARQGPSGPST